MTRRHSRGTAFGLAMAMLVASTVVAVPPAGAAPAPAAPVPAPAALSGLPANCTPATNGITTTVTCTFDYTGANQTWTVPEGVRSARVWVAGGQGGSGTGNQSGAPGYGGHGGTVDATVQVTGGQVFDVVIGGRGGLGHDGGAWPDGGPGGWGGSQDRTGCGGGGRSSLTPQGASWTIIAAGGGGCGGKIEGEHGVPGGAGGNPGQGSPVSAYESGSCHARGLSGQGANAAGPGWFGAMGEYLNWGKCTTGDTPRLSTSGQAYWVGRTGGQGGDAQGGTASRSGGGGGGGGGYYGGGGGGGGNDAGNLGGGGGGGGGQNFASPVSQITNVVHDTGVRTGTGGMAIAYELQASTLTINTIPRYVAGTPVSRVVTIAVNGTNVPSGTLTIDVEGSSGCTTAMVPTGMDGTPPHSTGAGLCDYVPVKAGQISVTASYSGNGGVAATSVTKVITVEKMPTSVRLAPSTDGSSLTATVTGSGTGVAFDGQIDVTANGSPLTLCTDLTVIDNHDGTATASCDVTRGVGSSTEYVATYHDGTDTTDATSAPFRDDVAKAVTSTDVSLTSGTLSYGETATATVSVSVLGGVTAGLDGTVHVTASRDGDAPVTVCATQPIDTTGVARCTWTPGAGTWDIAAAFSGGTQTEPSATTTPAVLSVGKATPVVSLVADPAGGSTAGQRVTLTAMATAAQAPVVGTTAAFLDNGTVVAGCAAVPVEAGAAECVIVPAVGEHTFTVTTTATTDVAAGSAALSGPSPVYPVGLQATTTTIDVTAPDPLPASITAGTPVTATAKVAAGGATVTGTIAFNDNGQAVAGCTAQPVVSGSATCTWVPAAGVTHSVNAAYSGDGSTAASATATPAQFATGRYVGSTALAVTAAGSSITLEATVTSPGPSPGGTVSFTDGDTPIAACGTPPAAAATCTIRAVGGTHVYRAVHSGDVATAPSTSPARTVAVGATPTAVTATARQASADSVTLTATVTAPGLDTVTPTGSVTFTAGAEQCSAVLVGRPGGGATATCTVAADPLATTSVTATYTPEDPAMFAGSAGGVDYTPVFTCPAGLSNLVANLAGGGTVTVDAGALGMVTVTASGTSGPCDGSTVLDVTVDATLFDGTLTATGLTGSITPGGFCIQSGSFALPAAWRAPTISVSTPICFSLAADGSIAGIDSGGLTAAFAAGSFLFTDLPGVPATALSLGFTTDGAVTTLQIGLIAGPADDPDVALGLTVATDGSFAGTLTTPGLTVLGQSLAGLSIAVSGGAGRPLVFDGQITLGPIEIAPGLVLSTITVTVANDGFTLAGSAEVGAAGHVVQLDVAGTVTDQANWSLSLAARGGPVWEPVSGLAIRPDFSGSVSSTDGHLTWSVRAGGSALAVWNPAPGVTVTIDEATLGNTGNACGSTSSGPRDVVLTIAGSLQLRDLTIRTSGCVNLTTGQFHLDAQSDSLTVTSGLTLTNVALSIDAAVSGAFTIVGGATATVSAGGRNFTLAVSIDLSSDGTLVVGGSVDLTDWGAPVTGYVAYASGPVAGFDTHDPSVGVNGLVDLPAGLTAVAVWTPSAGTAEVLERLGFTLGPGSTVDLAATLAPGRAITFHAALAAPDGLPVLALPGGVSVTGATLDFAGGTLTVVVDGTVAMPGGASDAVVHLTGTIGNGTFEGSATVQGLVVFGQRVDLEGSVRGVRIGGVLQITGSVTGRIPGPISVAGTDAVTLSDLTLTLGSDGIAVSGTADIAGRAGLTIEGTLTSVTNWTLAVTSSVQPWTPAPGLTISARLTGTISRTTSGVTFELAATGAAGALATFTPVDGFSIAIDEIRIGNSPRPPNGCAVTRSGDVWLYVRGSATLRIASTSGRASAAGCFDLTSGSLVLTADAANLSLSLLGGKVTVSGPVVSVTRRAQGYAVDASVDFTVVMPTGSTFHQTASLQLRSGGVFVVGVRTNLSNWLGSAGANAFLYYSNAAVRGFDTGDPAFGRVDLVSGITFAVKLTLPGNVAGQLAHMGLASPGAATVTAIGTADFSKQTYTLQVRFDAGLSGQKLFTTGSGVWLALDSGYLKLTVTRGSVSFGLGLDATLHTPAADGHGPGSDVGLNGEITISTTELKVALSLGDCGAPGDGWVDAFGVEGLTVKCAAVQGGIALAGPPLPTFGMMGTITSLPNDVADAIGFVNGAPISFAFNLDPFLLSIAVGTPGSTRVASRPLAMYGAPDAMAVYYAALYFSPTGAKIGGQTYPAGIGFAFQASLGGVAVSVLAEIDLSVPRLVFDGRVAAIAVGPITIGPAAVHLEVSPRTFAFTFDGAMTLGPAEVDLGVVRIGGRLHADVHLGVSPTAIEAWLQAQVSAYVSGYLPHAVCYWENFAPYPCDWWWDATGFDFTLGRTGFRLDSGGLVVAFDGYSLTLPFDGSKPAVST